MIDQKVAKVLLASGSKEVFVPITGSNTPHPEIKITLKKQPSGEINITYQDNGEGKFDGSDLDQADSLGMLLIQQLAIQLGATLTEDNHQGLKYSLTFDPTRFK
jgi:two-component sensor histidine kinase